MVQAIDVVIPIYAGVTHLDFTGPHQFLVRVAAARVHVASVGGRDVRAEGLVFSGLADLERIERADALVVPGGAGCLEAIENPRYLETVRRLAGTCRYVCSVCTGSLILGAAGLLKGKRAACHWAWRDMLSLFGAIPDSGRIVRDGHIFSGGGVTAGIDVALSLIAELAGPSVAQEIQLRLEYAPQPPFSAGLPETAPVEVLRRVRQAFVGEGAERRARLEKSAARTA